MSTMFDKAREAFANGQISWSNDTIKAVLIDLDAYTPNYASDQYLSVVPGAAQIGAAVTLTSKTNVAGVVDAADISISGLSSAPTLEGCLLFQSTGDPSTSRLIAMLDSSGATGLPVAAGALGVDIAWSNGTNKIFKL